MTAAPKNGSSPWFVWNSWQLLFLQVQQSFDQLRVHLDHEAVQDAFMMVSLAVQTIDGASIHSCSIGI